MCRFKKILTLGFLLSMIFVIVSAKAQSENEIKYVTLPGSMLWIDGSSTINEFTCRTHALYGHAYMNQNHDMSSGKDENKSEKDSVSVSIEVHTLDCGKDAMNNDMYHAMKASKFPFIKYELLDAKLSTKPDSSKEWFNLTAKGLLTIAGKQNPVEIEMKVKRLADGKYILKGEKQLSMYDYNIIPPTAFFGLIKAHDKLVVHFNIIAGTVESNIQQANNISNKILEGK